MRWSRESDIPVLQPVLHWGCFHTTTGQGVTFPLLPGRDAEAPIGLISSESSPELVQNQTDVISQINLLLGPRPTSCTPHFQDHPLPFFPPTPEQYLRHTLSPPCQGQPVQRSSSKRPWRIDSASMADSTAYLEEGINRLYSMFVNILGWQGTLHWPSAILGLQFVLTCVCVWY